MLIPNLISQVGATAPTELPEKLVVLRNNMKLFVNAAERLDANSVYVNMLLQYYYDCNSISQKALENEVSYAVINLSCCYEELSQELMERAYSGQNDNSQAWISSSRMGKRALGLVEYLGSSGIVGNESTASLVSAYALAWRLSQQLRMVVFTLCKLRAKLGQVQEGYDGLLELQEADLVTLSANSLLYGRLVLGCQRACRQLEATALRSHVGPLVVFTDVLALVLISMDRYNKDKCGDAIGMLEESLEKLHAAHLVPSDYGGFKDSRLMRPRTVDTLLHWKEKVKPKVNRAEQITCLHPFLQRIIQGFLLPLIILLSYRYKRTNDSLFLQKVERRRWDLPEGKAPDCVGIEWVFENGQLREIPESAKYY
ncbi:HDL059Cp [Eremothecium sinecaudum]|uniref:HDL059Cp n=1 Tax=Eremothecium sinecaudum TaxID=45286 RepID=A0A120K278_9SACH|nr:HDL059Cp [Eremothecium sinecaudum]AMD20685.1 HDL059Cp [Eremothecium sinecaudum]